MDKSQEYQREIKARLITLVQESAGKRGNMLTAEIISEVLGRVGISWRTIYRILSPDPKWLPALDVCPSLEHFIDTVRELRTAFGQVMETWEKGVFASMNKQAGGAIVLGFIFNSEYFSILRSEKPSEEKTEALVVQALRDIAEKFRQDREAYAAAERDKTDVQEFRRRIGALDESKK